MGIHGSKEHCLDIAKLLRQARGEMNGTFIFKDKKGKKRKELWKDDNFIKLI